MRKSTISKLLSLALVLLVSFSFLIACGGGEEKGADKQMEKKEVVLTWPCIWVGKDSKAPAIAALVDEFNAAHAGEIKVEIEAQPDYDGYEQKIRTEIAAKQVPDIFTMKINPTTVQYYETDLLMDFGSELSGSWGDSFNEGTIQASTFGGVTKSVPYETAITPVWYNMDLMKKAGVTEIPETMADFEAAAAKLKAAGIVPTSQMTGGSNAWTSMLWYSHFVGSLGGPEAWDKPLSDPIYVKAAAALLKMYSDGNTTKDAVGGDAGVSGGHYLAGRTAMFINGPWYIGRVRGDAPEVYEATEVGPAPAVGPNKGNQVGFLQTNLAAASTDDPVKKEAVLTFMKWLTKPENVARISKEAGSLFAVKYDASSIDDPLQRKFIEASNNATFTVSHLSGKFPTEVVSTFGQALGEMALGQATPEDFVKALQEANR